jgi:hypothetical protein
LIQYHRSDERPHWVATVILNGVGENMTAGYSFEVKVFADVDAPLLTKTTGIIGGQGGQVTVAWAPNELDILEGIHTAQLKTTRTADGTEWTVWERLQILPRA